jgi:hypothetical protein
MTSVTQTATDGTRIAHPHPRPATLRVAKYGQGQREARARIATRSVAGGVAGVATPLRPVLPSPCVNYSFSLS